MWARKLVENTIGRAISLKVRISVFSPTICSKDFEFVIKYIFNGGLKMTKSRSNLRLVLQMKEPGEFKEVNNKGDIIFGIILKL
jgi:hypothetical protein